MFLATPSTGHYNNLLVLAQNDDMGCGSVGNTTSSLSALSAGHKYRAWRLAGFDHVSHIVNIVITA